jgi:TolA-binding protein
MPWLSGSALLKLSQAFSQEGNDETAEKLMYEVQRRYPSHPLLKN